MSWLPVNKLCQVLVFNNEAQYHSSMKTAAASFRQINYIDEDAALKCSRLTSIIIIEQRRQSKVII